MSRNDWGWYPRYPKSTPRKVEDGIAARNARGGFASQWWARRWIAALEAFGWSNRLTRGKSYARQGQVMDYHLEPGRVTARVQGSRPRPYAVTIVLKRLSDEAWARAIDGMAGRAVFAARLLANEMPQDIEEAFTAAGEPLLPQKERDLQTECSCPDYANPCKHIAAVYYILAEAFDQDPFLIFQLRGRSKEDLLGALRERRSAVAGGDAAEAEPIATGVALGVDVAEGVQALPSDPDAFWSASRLPDVFDVGLEAPPVPHALLSRLGSPGPWARPAEFVRLLAPTWDAVSEAARRLALGGGEPAEAPTRRGPGRPRKAEAVAEAPARRGPGRPRKAETVAEAPTRRGPGRPRKAEARELTPSQKKALRFARDHDLTEQSYWILTNVSMAKARRELAALLEGGLLTPVRGRRGGGAFRITERGLEASAEGRG